MMIFLKFSRPGVLVRSPSSCRRSGVSAICLPQVVEGRVFLHCLSQVVQGPVFLYSLLASYRGLGVLVLNLLKLFRGMLVLICLGQVHAFALLSSCS